MSYENNQQSIITNKRNLITVTAKQSKSTPGIKKEYKLVKGKYVFIIDGYKNCKDEKTCVFLWVLVKTVENKTIGSFKSPILFENTRKRIKLKFDVPDNNYITTAYVLFRDCNINDIFRITHWKIKSQDKKPKLYWLLTTKKTLYPLKSGDVINETNIMKTMSKYFDVYYNNQLFDPTLKDFGIKDIPIKIPKKGKYDLHYVRNNKNVFNKLPSPKIWFASPYIKSCYKGADIVSTLTEPWTYNLTRYKPDEPFWGSLYKDEIHIPKKIITINQVISEHYSPQQGHPKTEEYKKKFGGKFIIGHFGRVSQSCYPYSLIHILPKLKEKYPFIKVVFSGNIQKEIKSKDIDVLDYIPYHDMPYAISACDLILFNHRTSSGQYAGSMKGLEAMMCKVPVLTPKFDARVVEFGENYPLFYPFEHNDGRFSEEIEQKMFDLLSEYIENYKNEKYTQLKEDLYQKAQYFIMENSSKRFYDTLKEFI